MPRKNIFILFILRLKEVLCFNRYNKKKPVNRFW